MTAKENMVNAVKQVMSNDYPVVREEFYNLDVFGYNEETGQTIEVEIKLADYDFYKEFNKPTKRFKHRAYRRAFEKGQGFCPTRFYFCVPYPMKDRALRVMRRRKRGYYGLLAFCQLQQKLVVVKRCEPLHDREWDGRVLKQPFKKGETTKVKL